MAVNRILGRAVSSTKSRIAFVPAGFVVFAPMRRGHGLSQGEYIRDTIARERQARGADAANRVMVREHETNQLEDQLAGLAFLETLPYVDTTKLAVAGCPFGGDPDAARGRAGRRVSRWPSPCRRLRKAGRAIRSFVNG